MKKVIGKSGIVTAALIAASLCAALLAGCAKKDSGAAAATGTVAPSTGGGQYDSILRTTQDWPTFTDPAVGNDQSDTLAMVQLYDPLVFPDTLANPAPHIATDWTFTDDGLSYTFNLRDDIKIPFRESAYSGRCSVQYETYAHHRGGLRIPL